MDSATEPNKWNLDGGLPYYDCDTGELNLRVKFSRASECKPILGTRNGGLPVGWVMPDGWDMPIAP